MLTWWIFFHFHAAHSCCDFHRVIIILCWASLFFPFFSADMLESNNLVTFEGLANSSAYHTFLLDEEKGRLVVGAKDHIFSFNLLNISRDYAQVTPVFDFQSVCLVFLSIYHDSKIVCVSDRLNICLECASPSRVPVRGSGISGLSFLFLQKRASWIFQTRAVTHHHTLCQAC